MDETNNEQSQPILMYFDESGYKGDIWQLEQIGSRLEAIKDSYKKIQLGELEFSEIQKVINNPADFVYEKMTKGTKPSVNGLKISKATALELFEKPAGYAVLLSKIEDFIGFRDASRRKVEIEEYFTCNEAGSIILKEDVRVRSENIHKEYAISNYAKSNYKVSCGILKLLQEEMPADYKALSNSDFGGKEFLRLMEKLIIHDRTFKTFYVNRAYIKELDRGR